MNNIELVYAKGVRVTKKGVVLNAKKESIGHIEKGYRKISFRKNGKVKKVRVGRFQAYQKYGNELFKPGIVTRHLDGNSLNDSWDNIAIGTNSDNQMDIPEEIRISRAKHAASFVKKYNYKAVREFYEECRSYKKTMNEFNISSKGTLNYILRSSLM